MPTTQPVARPKVLVAREQAMAPRVLVATPPPPARIDPAKPPGPGGSSFWRPGHWSFRGGRYVWMPGAWVVPPRDGLVWQAGFYHRTVEGGEWVEGHWRKE
jgi:hypothetical protein